MWKALTKLALEPEIGGFLAGIVRNPAGGRLCPAARFV
jgi:hypothetical protein